MNFLLDTCTYVWYYSEPEKLSASATDRMTDRSNRLWVSIVNVWEVLVKQRTGRADAPKGDIQVILDQHLREGLVQFLPLTLRHAAQLPGLPMVHHDPWDRMLICQALAEDLTILTPDKLIHQYPVPWEW